MSSAVLAPQGTRVGHKGSAPRVTELLWAMVVGLVSGVACAGVRLLYRMLQWIFVGHSGMLPRAAALLPAAHRALVPVVGAALATLVLLAASRWSRAAPFEEYVEAVRWSHGEIPFASTAWRTVSSAFSVATGAAIGREGSMIQFAATVTSWMAARAGRLQSRMTATRAKQVAWGAAAAVAAAYQAPLAGVFFAYEIVLGEWSWSDLPSLTLASFAGGLISREATGAGPLFAVSQGLRLTDLPWGLPVMMLLVLAAPLYQQLLRHATVLKRLPLPLLWGGLAVGVLSVAHPEVWGNGDVALLGTLAGGAAWHAMLTLLVFRLIATTLCVGVGTVGGVFTPTLFAGATLGLLAGHLLGAPATVLLAIVGMSSFLAAVTHAPWMAAFMAVELTGQWHLLPALLALNLAAAWMAAQITTDSLYAIATPVPAEDLPLS